MPLNRFRLRHSLAELAAQGLREGVLGRFSGLNEAQLDGPPFAPKEHRLAGELRAVVADNGIGQVARPLEVDLKKRPARAPVIAGDSQ